MIRTISVSPSLDRTYVTGDLVIDGVNRAGQVFVEAAGKGVNVSRALAAADRATVAVVAVGGADGAHLCRLLEDAGVTYRAVPVQRATRTNVTVLAEGSTTKINAPAAPLGPDELSALVHACGEGLTAGDWIVLSGSLPPDAVSLVPSLAALARSRDARLCVDTSGEALRAAIDERPALIAPNLPELCEVDTAALEVSSAEPAERVPHAAAAARRLARRTGGEVLLSLGELGAIWTDGQETWHGATPTIDVVNTAGAGDALLAGFLADPRAAVPERLGTALGWAAAACGLPTTSGPLASRARSADVSVRRISHDDLGIPVG